MPGAAARPTEPTLEVTGGATAIPVPEIAQRAEHVATLLRTIDESPADADVAEIEAQLASADEWAAAPTGSRPQPSPYNSRAWLDTRDRD